MRFDVPLPRVLNADGSEKRRLNVIDASVKLNLTPLSTAQLIIPATEELDIREWVRMYTSQGDAGVYRVRAPSQNYRLESKEYTLDHGIAEVGDYAITTDLELDTAANTAINSVFNYYTGTMWQLGQVVPTAKVHISGEENVLSALLSIMDQLPEHMMSFDQSFLPWTLNIIARPQTICGEGRLSRNVVSAKISQDDNDLCTRIISPNLQGGSMDADTISAYGVVSRYIVKDEDTTQADFEADCFKYLSQHKQPILSVDIDLRDLEQVTGEELDGIAIGEIYRLALPDYNKTLLEPVVSLYWKSVYGDPSAVEVTLASEETTLTSSMHSAMSSANDAIKKNKKEGEQNRYAWRVTSEEVTDHGNILHAAGLEIDPITGVWLYASEDAEDYALGSSFKVQADAITAEVSRATAAEGLVSSRIQQTADAITAEVSRAQGAEGQLSSRISVTAEQISTEVTNRTNADNQMSSRITQNANAIELRVEKNGVISAINQTAEQITISASKINLDGFVTSTQMQAAFAATRALSYTSASGATINNTGGIYSGNFYIQMSGGTVELGNAVASIGPATASGGQISIPWTTLRGASGTPVNFNIADTQFYKDGVAAVTLKSQNPYTWTNGVYLSNLGAVSATVTAHLTNDKTPSGAVLIPVSGVPTDTYTQVNYARKGLNSYGYAQLYVYERNTYYSAGTHYWYWSSSGGWDTLYEKD